jgi:hypothetical protein
VIGSGRHGHEHLDGVWTNVLPENGCFQPGFRALCIPEQISAEAEKEIRDANLPDV